jgi:hypothetical protein
MKGRRSGPPPPARARWRSAWIGAFVVLLTLLGFWIFPGHTFLHSDTQIYMAILERFWDGSVLERDLVAQDPHVSFTIYDEAALLLRRLTGLDFQQVLVAQQLVYRALGILGVFLLATALGLGDRLALLVAAAFSLGASILGPSVLSIEYEPVPRGFAVPLLLLALGLAAQGRDLAAGAGVAAAFLYHPPTVLPFWAVYFALTLWPAKPAVMGRRILGLAPIFAGVLVLMALSRMQTGIGEAQPLFGRLDPDIERLQRFRANYNWVSVWISQWIVHYLFLWALSLAAFWRVRKAASEDDRFFLVGLPLIGMLSVPASYVLLDRMKWILVPQVQPMRALLFVTVLAGILATVAAVKAGERGAYWETALWLLPVYAIPTHTRVLDLLVPRSLDPLLLRRLLVVLALAGLAVFAVWAETRKRRWSAVPWAAAAIAPFFVIPAAGKVVNYTNAETPELIELAKWARSSTARDALFLFPDGGRRLDPGIFRARALRAVYVDWKGGGQVNFLERFAREWWSRWKAAGVPAGVDYIVLRRENRMRGRTPVFENSGYVVYRAT